MGNQNPLYLVKSIHFFFPFLQEIVSHQMKKELAVGRIKTIFISIVGLFRYACDECRKREAEKCMCMRREAIFPIDKTMGAKVSSS